MNPERLWNQINDEYESESEYDGFANELDPLSCITCDGLLDDDEKWVCDKCLSEMVIIRERRRLERKFK